MQLKDTEIEIPDCIQIRGNRLLVRQYTEAFCSGGRSIKQVKAQANLEHNAPKGFMNRKIRSRIDKMTSNWIAAIEYEATRRKRKLQELITFVTLTLPSKQTHTDADLYRLTLMPFMQYLKRKFNAKHYVWRAERQDNGNLHYHVITDRFVPWHQVRAKWNDLIRPLGYIDAYGNNQRAWHADGFKVRQELLDTWTLTSQQKAYEYGTSTNWSDPNTTDIHRMEDVNNVGAYLTKYLSKSCLEMKQLEQLEKSFAEGAIDSTAYQSNRAYLVNEMQRHKINGRIWGCSDSLKEIGDFTQMVGDVESDLVIAIAADKETKIVKKDFCTIFYCRNLHVHLKKYTGVLKSYQVHLREVYNELYRPKMPDLFSGRSVYEILGIEPPQKSQSYEPLQGCFIF